MTLPLGRLVTNAMQPKPNTFCVWGYIPSLFFCDLRAQEQFTKVLAGCSSGSIQVTSSNIRPLLRGDGTCTVRRPDRTCLKAYFDRGCLGHYRADPDESPKTEDGRVIYSLVCDSCTVNNLNMIEFSLSTKFIFEL